MIPYFKIMYKIGCACKYLHYLLTSEHSRGHRIHSPFVYDFVTRVIKGPELTDYWKINKLREELSNDLSELQIIDMGAGSMFRSRKSKTIASLVKHTSISPKYGRLLSRLVGWLLPATIIELGTGTAISTMYMAVANEQSRVFSIEGSPDIARLAKQNINKLGLNNIEIFTGSFLNILPTILHKLKHDLFVFIDGDHYGDHLISYYELILPFANENTVLVLDDIRWSVSMERAWRTLIKRDEVSVSIDLFRMGIIFLKKNLEKQHYLLRF
jgi:predicted O-methyltransferase YrrM